MIHQILNKLPNFRGKLRLAKILLRNRHEQKEFITKKGTRYIVPNLIENVGLELLVNGIYEQETIEFICQKLPKNGVFFDVGANIGAVCIEVAKLRPDVRVYAFEAAPFIYGFLEQNIKGNKLGNITAYNLAVHEDGEIKLPFYSPKDLNGKGSFAPVFTDEAVMVDTVNLDKFIFDHQLYPDFIKIDVEGYEYLVLRSMINFLKRQSSSMILFEFGDWSEEAAGFKIGSAQDLLSQIDYRLFDFSTQKEITKTLQNACAMIIAIK